MRQAIDLETIVTVVTPGGAFAVEPGSLEVGGVPWITGGGGTYRFTEAETGRRIMVPVGAVCAIEVAGDGLRDDPSRLATSPVAAAFDSLVSAPNVFNPRVA